MISVKPTEVCFEFLHYSFVWFRAAD